MSNSLDSFLTRIGDVTIERVSPKDKNSRSSDQQNNARDEPSLNSISSNNSGISGGGGGGGGSTMQLNNDGDSEETGGETSDGELEKKHVFREPDDVEEIHSEGSGDDMDLDDTIDTEIGVRMDSERPPSESSCPEDDVDSVNILDTLPLEGAPIEGQEVSEADLLGKSLLKDDDNESIDNDNVPSETQSGDEDDENLNKRRADSDDNDAIKKKARKDDDSDNDCELKSEKKLANMRRNIREVMDEAQLDEATLAAQRQEMERLRRVQEQQKIIREVQRQMAFNRQNNKSQTRVISLLQGKHQDISTSISQSPSSSSASSTSSLSPSSQIKSPNTVLLKVNSGTSGSGGGSSVGSTQTRETQSSLITKRSMEGQARWGRGRGSGGGCYANMQTSISRIGNKGTSGQNISNRVRMMTPSVSISPVVPKKEPFDRSEYSDSDLSEAETDEIIYEKPGGIGKSSSVNKSQKPGKGKDVVTISSSSESSDDDCIVLSDPSGEEETDNEDDPSNSGMHTNDRYNVPDEHGRVLVNVGHPESEPDVYLAPQVARIIKPHQIGGIRFLYDNIVESIERYKNSSGFGCILAHSMGLGKTLQVASFCDIFFRCTPAKTVLCIMPINTLQNWLAEFNMWLPYEDPNKYNELINTPKSESSNLLDPKHEIKEENSNHTDVSSNMSSRSLSRESAQNHRTIKDGLSSLQFSNMMQGNMFNQQQQQQQSQQHQYYDYQDNLMNSRSMSDQNLYHSGGGTLPHSTHSSLPPHHLHPSHQNQMYNPSINPLNDFKQMKQEIDLHDVKPPPPPPPLPPSQLTYSHFGNDNQHPGNIHGQINRPPNQIYPPSLPPHHSSLPPSNSSLTPSSSTSSSSMDNHGTPMYPMMNNNQPPPQVSNYPNYPSNNPPYGNNPSSLMMQQDTEIKKEPTYGYNNTEMNIKKEPGEVMIKEEPSSITTSITSTTSTVATTNTTTNTTAAAVAAVAASSASKTSTKDENSEEKPNVERVTTSFSVDAPVGMELRPRHFRLHILNDSHKTMAARSRVIQEWQTTGGVLLIGYELYRQLSLKKPNKGKRKRGQPFKDTVDVEEEDKNKGLLDEMHSALVNPGPDLVICDEGHRIKNSHASISMALKQMRTKRRIVLTGYPLQNNLLEYWCMVDFVRPNYLGTKSEFCNMFERPIQNGQCIDSTPQDIRLMRYRAHVLHALLEGFVQRRSHSVLQISLPRKEEYILLVRMTAHQRKLYDTFMNQVVKTRAVPNPLKAFAVCCKIWNHPDILYHFLRKRQANEEDDLDLEETIGEKTTAGGKRSKGRQAKGDNKKGKKVNATIKNKPAASVPPNSSSSLSTTPTTTNTNNINLNSSNINPNENIDNDNSHVDIKPNFQNYSQQQQQQQQHPNSGYNNPGQSNNYSQNYQNFRQNDQNNFYRNEQSSNDFNDYYNNQGQQQQQQPQQQQPQQQQQQQQQQQPPRFPNQNQSFSQSYSQNNMGYNNQQNYPPNQSQNQPQNQSQNYQQQNQPQSYTSNSEQSGNNAQKYSGGLPINTDFRPDQSNSNNNSNSNSSNSYDMTGIYQRQSYGFQEQNRSFSSNINHGVNQSYQQQGTGQQVSNYPNQMSNQQTGVPIGDFPPYNQQQNQNQNYSSGQNNSQQIYPQNESQSNQVHNYPVNQQQPSNAGPQMSHQGALSNQPGGTNLLMSNQSHMYPSGRMNPNAAQGNPSNQMPSQMGSVQNQSIYPPNQPTPNSMMQSQQHTGFIQNSQQPNQPNQMRGYSSQQQQQQQQQQNQNQNQYNVQQNQTSYSQGSTGPLSTQGHAGYPPDQQVSHQSKNNYSSNHLPPSGVTSQQNSYQMPQTSTPVNQQQQHNYPSNPTIHQVQNQLMKFPPGSSNANPSNTIHQNQQNVGNYNSNYNSNANIGQNEQLNTTGNYQQSSQTISNYQTDNNRQNQYKGQDQNYQWQGNYSQSIKQEPCNEQFFRETNTNSRYQNNYFPSQNFPQNSSFNYNANNELNNSSGGNDNNKPSQTGIMSRGHSSSTTTTASNNYDKTIKEVSTNIGVPNQSLQSQQNNNSNFNSNNNSDSNNSKTMGNVGPCHSMTNRQNSTDIGIKEEEKDNKDEIVLEKDKEEVKSDDEILTKEEEKEFKSSPSGKEEPGIPYDWATELMKGYVPGLIDASAKMTLFFCILEEAIRVGDRVLAFSQSLFTLNLIEDFLARNHLKYPDGQTDAWIKNINYYRLDGSTSALEREKLINEFNNNPKIHLFLVSTRAGSLGINLVGANRAIVFDASWNPCHDTQAVCRVYRYGQKKPCYVYRLVTDNCLERKIYDRQISKQGMADRVVDQCNPDAHLSLKEATTLSWEWEEDGQVQDFSSSKDNYSDHIMQLVLEKYSPLLTKEPFHHESLLVDRKDKKLSQAEKRLARRGYELEKMAANSSKPSYNYVPGNTATRAGGLQIRAIRGADTGVAPKPVASVRPMQQRGVENIGSGRGNVGSRWIPAEVWQRQGMSAQEMTLPLDVVIPTNSPDKSSIVLKAGQRVMVLKSPKGIYMQLESGKIIAIRTALKINQQKREDEPKKAPASSIQRNAKSEVSFPLRNNSAISIIPKGTPTTTTPKPVSKSGNASGCKQQIDKDNSRRPRAIPTPVTKGNANQVNLTNQVSLQRISKTKQDSVDHSLVGENSNSSDSQLRTDQRVEEVRLEDVVAEAGSNSDYSPSSSQMANLDLETTLQRVSEGKTQDFGTNPITSDKPIQGMQTPNIETPISDSDMTLKNDKSLMTMTDVKEIESILPRVGSNNFGVPFTSQLGKDSDDNFMKEINAAKVPTKPPPVMPQPIQQHHTSQLVPEPHRSEPIQPPQTQSQPQPQIYSQKLPEATKNLPEPNNSSLGSTPTSINVAPKDQHLVDTQNSSVESSELPSTYPYAQYPRYYDYADQRSRNVNPSGGPYYSNVPAHSAKPRAVPESPKIEPEITKAENRLPINIPSESRLPINAPLESRLPINAASESRLPMNVPSENRLPINVPSENRLPMNVPSENRLPINVPSENRLPMNVPSESRLPMNVPPENRLPMNVPSENRLPINIPQLSIPSGILPMANNYTQSASVIPPASLLEPIEVKNSEVVAPPVPAPPIQPPTTTASITPTNRVDSHTPTAFTHPTNNRYSGSYPTTPYDPYSQHYTAAPNSTATYPPSGAPGYSAYGGPTYNADYARMYSAFHGPPPTGDPYMHRGYAPPPTNHPTNYYTPFPHHPPPPPPYPNYTFLPPYPNMPESQPPGQ